MTSFATDRASARSRLQHVLLELAFVRVSMATGAGEILPVIDHGRLWFELLRLFMAVTARNRDVPVSQNEVCLSVASQRERRWLVALEIVAAVASVEIGCSRELSGMLVAMTVGAALELDFEQSVFPLGDVALRTLQPGVPTL